MEETTQMPLQLSVERSLAPSGDQIVRLGHELLDDYLTFLASRARPNSVSGRRLRSEGVLLLRAQGTVTDHKP